ncbi:hypothetical protein M422DRAFT_260197 [Sphaerobolus stellatus SS14]|uniref:F-box domain-containing protein n=1 Tax=Sphaerobolus stellatus (strain SS14) TaxID=990650 RepID=A0A0C9V6R5_SPHS4|nr:hypothetical protein M422DRAFT_260197 [Sphaerobolus stellatus SS14]
MSTSGFFSNLPAELLEPILNDIANVNDLLSLALTSRAFCKLVIPWHIEYRWICCPWERTDIWIPLSTKPYLAARIQHLDIWHSSELVVFPRSLATFPEYKEVAPSLPKGERGKIFMPALIKLIENCSNLTHFRCDLPRGELGSYTDFVVNLFEHSPWLQELQIYGDINCDDTSDFLHINSLNKYKPTLCLRAVYFSFFLQNESNTPSKVIDLLIHSCPSLVDIGLTFITKSDVPIPQFLLQGSWSKLTRLTLHGDADVFYSKGLPDSAKAQIMRNFFSRHLTIECLSFAGNGLIFAGCIEEGSLPNMQSLYMCVDIPAAAILPTSVTMAGNIKHLSLANVTSDCLDIIGQMTSLQSCVIITTDEDHALTTLLDAFPVSVERINIVYWGSQGYNAQTWLDTIDTWEPSFRRLKNVTHIANVFSSVNFSTAVSVELMRKLCEIMPRLSYVVVEYIRWIMMKGIREQSGEYDLREGTRIDDHWVNTFDGIHLIGDKRITWL